MCHFVPLCIRYSENIVCAFAPNAAHCGYRTAVTLLILYGVLTTPYDNVAEHAVFSSPGVRIFSMSPIVQIELMFLL